MLSQSEADGCLGNGEFWRSSGEHRPVVTVPESSVSVTHYMSVKVINQSFSLLVCEMDDFTNFHVLSMRIK